MTAVDGFKLNSDGLPRYRMSRKLGPLLPAVTMTSVYTKFERPNRAVNHVVDTPLRGDFVATYDQTPTGTRITWRWEIGAENSVVNALLALLRPVLVRSLHKTCTSTVRRPQGRAHSVTLDAPMSEGTPEDDRPTTSGEELKRDDEGAGVGFEDKPTTFEPEEEPEATDTK